MDAGLVPLSVEVEALARTAANRRCAALEPSSGLLWFCGQLPKRMRSFLKWEGFPINESSVGAHGKWLHERSPRSGRMIIAHRFIGGISREFVKVVRETDA